MSSFVKEQHLSLYRELKITKTELQQAIGEDLHNVECQKAYHIKRSDVVNAIQLLQNGTISKDTLVGKTPVKSEVTQFGTKHTYKTEITGKDGKSVRANVVVVIQKDNGRITYKIVTVYPDKKGE